MSRSTNIAIFPALWTMVILIILIATITAPAMAQDPDTAARPPGLASTPPGTAERLEAVMQHIVERFPGRIGVYAEHIESGIAAGVDPDSPYGMASTYKVPILVEMMARVESGEWSLDMPIDLTVRDQHIGSGLLADLWAPGLTLSLKNLATMMIILSDNSATDMLIDRVGAAEVTARMQSLGLQNIRVDRTTLELILDYNGIDYEPVADAPLAEIIAYREQVSMTSEEVAAAREMFYEGPEDKATARDMTALLIMIAEGRALEKESCDVILEILERTRTGANRLRGLLPPGTRLAHKTGTIGRILDDVGIIYLPNGLGRVAISVFTLADEPDGERAEAAIADLARTVYDFFVFNAPATEKPQ